MLPHPAKKSMQAVVKGMNDRMRSMSCLASSLHITLLGVLLLSGYHPYPSRRLYWNTADDVKNDLVPNAIRRNRFESMLRFLHLADNSKLVPDRMFKVRPLIDSLNEFFKIVSPGKSCTVDESMIPYYGHHGCRQFIRGKPIRFVFKLWCLANVNCYIIHAEPYCGSDTRLPETGLGQGGNVVLGLINHSDVKPGTRVYFDNLFTSEGLMRALMSKGIGGTGTVRENRVKPYFQLTDKKVFRKESRGVVEAKSDGDLVVTRWKDNAVITEITNCDHLAPFKTVERYSVAKKSKVIVSIPSTIYQYDVNKGGVDLNDQFVAQYRTIVRTKKWWWPFFGWAVDVSCVQGWLVYRKFVNNSIPLLDFRRECVLFLLRHYGSQSTGRGPRTTISVALDPLRLDRKDHIIIKGSSRFRRCRHCTKRTIFVSRKCNIPLHPKCFENFQVP